MNVYLAIATSVFLWANAFLAIQVALQELTPIELTVFRFLPLVVPFGLYIYFVSRKRALEVLRAYPIRIAAIALLMIPVYNWLVYMGQRDVSPSLAALIVGSAPLFTYLMATGTKQESFEWYKLTGLAVAFAGLFLALRYGSGVFSSVRGGSAVLLVFGAMLCNAATAVLIRSIVRRHAQAEVMQWGIVLGSLPLVFWLRPADIRHLMGVSNAAWVSLIYLSLGSTVGGTFAWFYALRHLPASRVVVFANIMPLITMSIGYLYFGQKVTHWLVLGACLVAAGIYLTNRDRPRLGPGPQIV